MTFAPRDPSVLIDKLARNGRPFEQDTLRRLASQDPQLRMFLIHFVQTARDYIRELREPPLIPFSRRSVALMRSIREELQKRALLGQEGQESVNERPLEECFTPKELLSFLSRDKKREVVAVQLSEEAMRKALPLLKKTAKQIPLLYSLDPNETGEKDNSEMEQAQDPDPVLTKAAK